MKARVVARHRGLLPILVAFAVAVLVGHICALPAAAEWEAVGAADSRTPADSHDSDGSHVASCDATISRAAPACSPTTDTPLVLLSAVADLDRSIPAQAVTLETPSPSRRARDRSLFLLHASFLI